MKGLYMNVTLEKAQRKITGMAEDFGSPRSLYKRIFEMQQTYLAGTGRAQEPRDLYVLQCLEELTKLEKSKNPAEVWSYVAAIAALATDALAPIAIPMSAAVIPVNNNKLTEAMQRVEKSES
jgi:hypothetical protein